MLFDRSATPASGLSIDTDRVFLSGPFDGRRRGLGHRPGASRSVGRRDPDRGDAAANTSRQYRENGKYVAACISSAARKTRRRLPTELDDWDHYLKHSIQGYDAMIVQYQGRGHEHFLDEILNLFTWMNLHKRDFFPEAIRGGVAAAVGQLLLVGRDGRSEGNQHDFAGGVGRESRSRRKNRSPPGPKPTRSRRTASMSRRAVAAR